MALSLQKESILTHLTLSYKKALLESKVFTFDETKKPTF